MKNYGDLGGYYNTLPISPASFINCSLVTYTLTWLIGIGFGGAPQLSLDLRGNKHVWK